MTNYAVTVKIIRGSQGDIETLIANYLASIADTKVLRSITTAKYGSDQLITTIIHDT